MKTFVKFLGLGWIGLSSIVFIKTIMDGDTILFEQLIGAMCSPASMILIVGSGIINAIED